MSGTKPILMIVEASGKVDKFQKYLGNGYIVCATNGHIIDLDKHSMSINFEKDFEPIYTTLEGKGVIINKLKTLYKKSSDVLIGSDLDREGEMIAWSIAKELNLKKPKRIVFGDTTKNTVLNSVKNYKDINYNLVDAQKLRRLLDRIIGYTISPLLWKSVGGGQLSAGRVQSVIVKLIIEKENEINDFFSKDSKSFFKISGELDKYKVNLYNVSKTNNKESNEDSNEESDNKEYGEIKKGIQTKINKESDVKEIMKHIIKSIFKVSGIMERKSIRRPSPPFTTSTLQQEASYKLGFGLKRTMNAAQHLYEAGHITYMRTDSVNLSDEALETIGEYIKEKYGKEFHQKINYKSKSKNTQEAHEACRPTDPKVTGVGNNGKIGNDEIRLYNLIWKRSIASQMTPAIFKVITIQIEISRLKDYFFVTQVENNIFLGYLAVYNIANIEQDEETNEINSNKIILPKIGNILKSNIINAIQDYMKPPIRYNDGSLAKKVDTLGIGRPATTASFVEKIIKVGYVVKEDNEGVEKETLIYSWDGEKLKETKKKILLGKDIGKYVPSSLGILVNDFLIENFPDIMDYKFTANMEDQLDDVAEGKLKWNILLNKFYETFKPLVDKIDKNIKVKEIVDKHARDLGVHPESGNKIIATIAKYGSIIKMIESKTKSIIAPIKKPLTLENITLKDALKLLEFPKKLGHYQKKSILLNRGKFGYYLSIGTDKIGLKINDDEVEKFNIDDAIKQIEENNKKILWQEKDDKYKYLLLEGPYGKYILAKPIKGKLKGKNYKFPNDKNIDDLTLEFVQELISKSYKKYKKPIRKPNV